MSVAGKRRLTTLTEALTKTCPPQPKYRSCGGGGGAGAGAGAGSGAGHAASRRSAAMTQTPVAGGVSWTGQSLAAPDPFLGPQMQNRTGLLGDPVAAFYVRVAGHAGLSIGYVLQGPVGTFHPQTVDEQLQEQSRQRPSEEEEDEEEAMGAVDADGGGTDDPGPAAPHGKRWTPTPTPTSTALAPSQAETAFWGALAVRGTQALEAVAGHYTNRSDKDYARRWLKQPEVLGRVEVTPAARAATDQALASVHRMAPDVRDVTFERLALDAAVAGDVATAFERLCASYLAEPLARTPRRPGRVEVTSAALAARGTQLQLFRGLRRTGDGRLYLDGCAAMQRYAVNVRQGLAAAGLCRSSW